MNRVLLKLALTRKKKTPTATEQETPRIQEPRRKFIDLARTLDPRRLVFLDEAGSHIAMTRDYARAPRGVRAYGSVPRSAGTVTTMIGALDLKGVRAMMTIEGATDAEVVETFLVRVLAQAHPGDIAHKVPKVRRIIEAASARVLYLPPYCPDLNPIELAWSKLKALHKEFGTRTQAALARRFAGRWISSVQTMLARGSVTAGTELSKFDSRARDALRMAAAMRLRA